MPHPSWKNDLLRYFPERLRPAVLRIEPFAPLTEIRLRVGKPIELVFSGYERLIGEAQGVPLPSEEDVRFVVSAACGASVYAFEEELSNGFVTLHGGYRMGVSGRAVTTGAGTSRLLDFQSLCIRVCRAFPGASGPLIPLLTDDAGRPLSALIASPPGKGKTTLLRDVARAFSMGLYGAAPARVAVVDTRYELAGCVQGGAVFDLGPRADVRSGGAKAGGILSMVRSMAPQLVVTDEIGSAADAAAILDAAASGVAVIASAHGANLSDLARRSALSELIYKRAFDRYVLLSGAAAPGTVEAVYAANGERLCLGGNVWQKALRS